METELNTVVLLLETMRGAAKDLRAIANSKTVLSATTRMRILRSAKSLADLAGNFDKTGRFTLDTYRCEDCGWKGEVGLSVELVDGDACPECNSQDLRLLEK